MAFINIIIFIIAFTAFFTIYFYSRNPKGFVLKLIMFLIILWTFGTMYYPLMLVFLIVVALLFLRKQERKNNKK